MEKEFELFCSAADAGSFSRAAKTGYISRQAIIKQIDHLEDRLGTQLFVRHSRGIILTDAGQLLYDGLKDLSQQEHTLLASVRSLSQKCAIRLSHAPHRIILEPINRAFMKNNPHIPVTRSFFRSYDEISLLLDDKIDIGEIPAAKTAQLPGELSYSKVLDYPVHSIMMGSDPLAVQSQITCHMLAGRSVYLDGSNNLAISQDVFLRLKDTCTIILLDRSEDRLGQIMNLDLDGKIYITQAPFSSMLAERVALPITDIPAVEYGIIYRKDAPAYIKQYVEFASHYY